MSEKVRRQKDIVKIIKNVTNSYDSALNTYQNYFDGTSPVLITYYQIADEASRTDTSLEDTHEVIGTQSSIFYYSIKHVSVYGVSLLDIQNQLTQRGLESFINGDFVMTPDININPRPGEFFSFEDGTYPELNQHLFEITDTQYDKATNSKFYKCTYKLYPKDTDNIKSQIVKKFVYDPDGNGNEDGVGNPKLVTEESAARKDQSDYLVDGLIDRYTDLFYNQGMDTFTYQKKIGDNEYEYYWCPYTCHYIYKTGILEKTDPEFLEEIYVQDISENTHPMFYSEDGYRKSLYFATEVDDPSVLDSIESSLLNISSYDMSKPLNLPFYSAPEKYNLVDVYHDNKEFLLGAFNYMFSTEDDIYFNCDKIYVYNANEGLERHFLINGLIGESQGDDADINQDKIDNFKNKVYYGCTDINNKLSLTEMFYANINDANNPIIKCDLGTVLTGSISLEKFDYMVDCIRKYFTATWNITDDEIKKINNYYYNNSMKTYILMPILIYILKQYKGE